jgi:hypothetical protein
MPRGLRSWILAAAGVVAVVIVAAAIGGRDKSGDTVAAGEWAQNVCGAVGVWRGELEDIVNDIRTPPAVGSLGAEEPQSETQQGRTALIREGVNRAVQATETLVEGIDNAGIPDTDVGEESAQQVSDWADGARDDLQEAEDTLDEEADTVEESVTQLTGAAQVIAESIRTGISTLAEVASSDPQLVDAVRESSTCRELREDTGT